MVPFFFFFKTKKYSRSFLFSGPNRTQLDPKIQTHSGFLFSGPNRTEHDSKIQIYSCFLVQTKPWHHPKITQSFQAIRGFSGSCLHPCQLLQCLVGSDFLVAGYPRKSQDPLSVSHMLPWEGRKKVQNNRAAYWKFKPFKKKCPPLYISKFYTNKIICLIVLRPLSIRF